MKPQREDPLSADAQEFRRRFRAAATMAPVREEAAGDRLIPAAVLVPVVDRPGGLTMLLTKRTDHLQNHPGQVSFPGGHCEDRDGSAVVTALREAQEEIGLKPARVDVLGMLPEYHTGTGFRITPIVGVVTLPLDLRVDRFEVAEVFETPLAFLLDPANHRRMSMRVRGKLREYWAMPYEGRFIWGATAGMIVSLYRLLDQ